jgi:putative acetyltransferase
MSEVKIRAFQMTDWEDVVDIFLAPRCQWYTLQMPYQSRDEIKQKLENPPEGMYRLVAVLNDTNKVVGLLGLNTFKERRAHVGYLGMSIHDDYQGKGIGSQLMIAIMDFAQNWLQLKRIELNVYTDNTNAIHLYEKYGFVIEGTMRKYAIRGGVYSDAYSMAWVSDS